jgi:hypothetical protein
VAGDTEYSRGYHLLPFLEMAWEVLCESLSDRFAVLNDAICPEKLQVVRLSVNISMQSQRCCRYRATKTSSTLVEI